MSYVFNLENPAKKDNCKKETSAIQKHLHIRVVNKCAAAHATVLDRDASLQHYLLILYHKSLSLSIVPCSEIG